MEGQLEDVLDPVELRRIFVGGLLRETTDAQLGEHFARYGPIEESVVKKNAVTGLSRGFGFVTFRDNVVKEVFTDGHIIGAKQVRVERAVPRGQVSHEPQLYVGGLPASITEEAFKAFLSNIGALEEAFIVHDEATGRSLGYGFVKFKHATFLNNALPMTLFFDDEDATMINVRKAKRSDSGNHQKVFVGGLPWWVSEEDFAVFFFTRYGIVKDSFIVRDKVTGRSRGCGFITFNSPEVFSDIPPYGIQIPFGHGVMVTIKRPHPIPK